MNEIVANGSFGWNAAVDWADQLVYGGFSDWRLPTLNPNDTTCTGGAAVGIGFNCTGGELSGLFVTDLGYNAPVSGLIPGDDTAEQIANKALFSNLQPYYYWSGTKYVPTGQGWSFGANDGGQDPFDAEPAGLTFYAVAVRAGDVPAAVPTMSVPEPQTLALALLALGATVVVRRRRPV